MKHFKNGAVPDLGNICEKESHKPDETGGQDGEFETGPRGFRGKLLNDRRATEKTSKWFFGEEGCLSMEHLERAWAVVLTRTYSTRFTRPCREAADREATRRDQSSRVEK